MNIPKSVFDVIYILALYKVLVFFALSLIHFRNSQKIKFKENGNPLVSVIIPCFNEELTIINCLESVLDSDHKNIEVVVVNDGSRDSTLSIIQEFAKTNSSVNYYDKQNGGKASALNLGIEKAKGNIVVCIDADSILSKDALSKLIRWFGDERIGAVSGNVKIANKNNFWGIHQAGEYISGLNLQRRSFEILGALQVIPGAIGAFRKDVLKKAGGYSTDTKVEDMDITVAIQKIGYKVIYEPKAVAYTEAPENLRDFIRQRHRWIYGSFRVIKKYRDMILSKNGGMIGNVGLTYSLIFPLIDLVMSIVFIATVIDLFLTSNYVALLHMMLIISASHFLIILYSLLIDEDNFEIAFISVFLGVWYYHLLSAITLMAIYSFMTSKKETHIVAKRLGRNKFTPAV